MAIGVRGEEPRGSSPSRAKKNDSRTAPIRSDGGDDGTAASKSKSSEARARPPPRGVVVTSPNSAAVFDDDDDTRYVRAKEKLARHRVDVSCLAEEVRSVMMTTKGGSRAAVAAAAADDDDGDGIDALARIAYERGLAHARLRRVAWPRLLGIDAEVPGNIDAAALDSAASRSHRDSRVVECDVERSLWAFTRGWSDERRDAKRGELRRVINSSVCAHEHALPGVVSYYQGYHDVAGVLVMVFADDDDDADDCNDGVGGVGRGGVSGGGGGGGRGGDSANEIITTRTRNGGDDYCNAAAAPRWATLMATATLERMALFHLRDCTRPTLKPVQDALDLVMVLLRRVDSGQGGGDSKTSKSLIDLIDESHPTPHAYKHTVCRARKVYDMTCMHTR